GRTSDAGAEHFAEYSFLSQGQKSQGKRRGEATRIRNVTGGADRIAVYLRKPVYKRTVLYRFTEAKVLTQVDDPGVSVKRLLLQKLFALAMTQAKKDHVDLLGIRI